LYRRFFQLIYVMDFNKTYELNNVPWYLIDSYWELYNEFKTDEINFLISYIREFGRISSITLKSVVTWSIDAIKQSISWKKVTASLVAELTNSIVNDLWYKHMSDAYTAALSCSVYWVQGKRDKPIVRRYYELQALRLSKSTLSQTNCPFLKEIKRQVSTILINELS
jgi:hypothetical protein